VSEPRARGRDIAGLLLLDKPHGLTSNGALQRVKRLYQAAKAGHTGSLDPLATGMLPICFGAATRVGGYLLDAHKTYHVVARLGVATDTGDAEGQIVREETSPIPTLAEVTRTLPRLVGEMEQIPPMYSALKRGGVPLYRLARRGVEVPRAPRRVVIHSMELVSYAWPDLTFVVRCSKGTYVRVLVTDLAIVLGTCGHVRELRRLSVEPFEGRRMHTLDELTGIAASGGLPALDALLLPADSALPDWPEIVLDAATAARLAQGQAVIGDPAWPRGLVRVYAPVHAFLAIGEVSAEGWLAPKRVFSA
jgi:tRNA pseudouridine55 synthase